jgi:hypothetical protein
MIAATLPHVVGMELAHAAVQYAAAGIDVRILFMKGLVAQRQGLRDPSLVPADVDVIVDPSRFMVFIEAMQHSGWRARYDSPEAPRMLGMHSVTLIHPDWPCDIDAHYFLPGFFWPPQQVFDRLWAQHEEITLAGKPAPVPARADHLALLGVNALRAPHQARYVAELSHLAVLLRADEGLRQSWMEALVRLGVRSVSTPLVDRLGAGEDEIPFNGDLAQSDAVLWHVYVASENPDEVGALRYWGGLFHAANGKDRWRSLLRVLWKPRRELERTHPEIEMWNARVVFRLETQRWRRGVTRGLGELVRARKARAALGMVRGPRTDLAIPDLDDVQMVSGEELRVMVNGHRRQPSSGVAAAAGNFEVDVFPGRVIEAQLGAVTVSAADPVTGGGVAPGQESVFLLCVSPHRPAGPKVLLLTGTGAMIWSQIKEADQTPGQITAALAQRVGCEPGAIAADVSAFIAHLQHEGAIHIHRM